ncbi:MAG: YXWGXW repeat-containing protein [Candidatus Omnitrophota bacterium]|nr:YXWGXW repeat-containing protein [Candidatus Omnitrophota bacterium]
MDRKFVVAALVSLTLLAGSGTAFARERGDSGHDRGKKGYVVTTSSQIKLSFPGVLVNLNLSRDRDRFVWVPGYWQYRGPHYGYVWVPGRWEKSVKYCHVPAHPQRQYADSRHRR